jgi:hypothetical protein
MTFGYYLQHLINSKKYMYIAIIASAIIFTTISNIILIIYGLKMHQNNICTDIDCPYSKCLDDFKIARFIIAFGIICVIFSFFAIIFLIYEKFINSEEE